MKKTEKTSNVVNEDSEFFDKLNSPHSIPNVENVNENDLKNLLLGIKNAGEILSNLNDNDNKKKDNNNMNMEDVGGDEDYPNLLVQVEYYDITYEDLPENDEFVENTVLTPANNLTKDALIILKNDDNGKKIILKGSDDVIVQTETPKNSKEIIKPDTTTPKPFSYSPTIPHASDRAIKTEVTTNKYDDDNNNNNNNKNNFTDVSPCFSTKLSFCEGILPYDVVQLPNLPGIKSYEDLTSLIPYFQMIVDSECSLRAREFICSILEPECQPEGQRLMPPCKLNCKVFSDDCKDYIINSLPLSNVFDCNQYPDWQQGEECVNFSKDNCHDEEFRCSDGTCIPLKWVCDGVHDCPGSTPSHDESICQGCSENEFRCIMDGKCIPMGWKCDGEIDCIDHSDETSCQLNSTSIVR